MQQSQSNPNQQSSQSQQYHAQKVNALVSNFRTQPNLDFDAQNRVKNINNAGLQFAMAIEQNTQTGYEQTIAIERALESRQWGEDAVRSQSQQNR